MTASRPKLALSVTAAAELLPIGADAGRRWLRERGLVRVILGREMVLVADVEAQIRIDSPAAIDRALGLLPEPAAAPVRARPRGAFVDPR